MSRLLVLMRHAEAADPVPGRPDRERPLTARGHAQAREAAELLAGLGIEHALVSSALRTRQTAADLGLGCPVEHLADLYNADSEAILRAVAEAPEEARALLVLAHNPGIHQAVLELADLGADPRARQLAVSFPTATAVGLRLPAGGWDVPRDATVDLVHLSRV